MAAQLTEAEERTVQRLFVELITAPASRKGPQQGAIFAGRAPRIVFHCMARLGASDAAATAGSEAWVPTRCRTPCGLK